jgi:hypothetical protein
VSGISAIAITVTIAMGEIAVKGIEIEGIEIKGMRFEASAILKWAFEK